MSSSTDPRPTSSGTGIRKGPFLIQLAGLPPKYSWKDLKDSVRPYATHSVWTDIQVVGPNDRRGSIKLTMWTEAITAYNKISQTYVEGTSRVPYSELWDISDSPPKMLQRNFNPDINVQQAQYQHVQNVVNQSGQPQSTASYQSQMQQTQTSPYGTPLQGPSRGCQISGTQQQNLSQAQMVQYLQQQQQQQQALQAYAYGQAIPQQHMIGYYAATSAGLPVNVTQGATPTEARAVFVQNLPYKAKDSDIAQFFGKAGKVVQCNLAKDTSKGGLKGHGTIKYGSLQEAQRAIDILNGKEFMSRILTIRFDTEQTATAPPREPGPLIVDGSGPAGAQQKFRSR